MPHTILLAEPRGFCAGVVRAIDVLDRVLEQEDGPIYAFHEIVHNRYVVDSFRRRGAIFIDAIDEVPPGSRIVFSAHGVSPGVVQQARDRELRIIDATCPLVTKVHLETRKAARDGFDILLVGHEGHDEVEGTRGEAEDRTHVVDTPADVQRLGPMDRPVFVVTQTTLSVDDTAAIVAILEDRFPGIVGPHREDICYATTNRQEAVKRIAGRIDAMIVIGAPNSSNSQRLREVAERAGCPFSVLVQRATDLDRDRLKHVRAVGITAGASAPEVLVEEVIDALAEYFTVKVETVRTADESITFNLPRPLREAAE